MKMDVATGLKTAFDGKENNFFVRVGFTFKPQRLLLLVFSLFDYKGKIKRFSQTFFAKGLSINDITPSYYRSQLKCRSLATKCCVFSPIL